MAGITHVAWKADMEQAIAITGLLRQRMQARADGVAAAGGNTSEHLSLLAGRAESLGQAGRAGEQVVAAADGVHVPIGHAIAGAGKGWTAEAKAFNTATA